MRYSGQQCAYAGRTLIRGSLDQSTVSSAAGKGINKGLFALSSAFFEHNRFLKQFLTRFLKCQQDREDVIQETYLRAYRAEQDAVIKQPKAFLYRVASNIALNELRQKLRQITDYIEDCNSEVVTATLESEIEAQQLLGLYCEAIAHLPEKYRKVFLLRKVHGLHHKEITEHLGLTVSSVEKYLDS